jgi:hypothetical protein
MRVYRFLDAQFGLKSLYERRLKISRIEDLNDPFELLPFDLTHETVRSHVESVKANSDRVAGLLCFSSSWSSPLIWAHYGDKHKGLSLGFEIPNGDQVIYTPKPIQLALDASTEEKRKHVTGYKNTKYAGWRYEDEVRVWKKLEHQEGLCFADFGDDLRLFEVIAGMACPITEAELVRAIADPSVKIVKARRALNEFKIVEDENGFAKAFRYP